MKDTFGSANPNSLSDAQNEFPHRCAESLSDARNSLSAYQKISLSFPQARPVRAFAGRRILVVDQCHGRIFGRRAICEIPSEQGNLALPSWRAHCWGSRGNTRQRRRSRSGAVGIEK
jgi:hypothetical protein